MGKIRNPGHVVDSSKFDISPSSAHIEDVRNFPPCESDAKIVASQVANLDYKVSIKQGFENIATEQYNFWTAFMQEQAQSFVYNLYLEAWAYNVAFADPGLVNNGKWTLTDFIIIPNKSISNLNNVQNSDTLYVNGWGVPKERELEFRLKDSTQPNPGTLLWPFVSAYQIIHSAETLSATFGHNTLSLKWDKAMSGGDPTPAEIEQAKSFITNYGTAIHTAGVLPYWDVSIQGPESDIDYTARIKHNRNIIRNSFNLLWMDEEATGTYGSRVALQKMFSADINSIADRFCRALEAFAKRLAWLNYEGFYLNFTHTNHEVESSSVVDRIDAIVKILGAPLTNEQKQAIYPDLKLPIGPEMTASKSDRQAWMSSKKIGAKQGFYNSLERKKQGIPTNFKLTGYQNGPVYGIEVNKAKSIWVAYEELFKSALLKLLIEGDPETVFETIWKEFEREVLNA
ncbi:MAG TPA: hypothetical protein PLS96_11770 [Myxococcota bacterium]|nr:hypothetical protein [Myxococcota bacterium]